jgi:hypothetical protein
VTSAPPATEFHLDDAVRILVRHGDVHGGALGRILGKFPRAIGSTYAVSFEHWKVSVLELRPDEIVLADDFPLVA